MEKIIKEKIGRLSELVAAGSMMELGTELTNEFAALVKYFQSEKLATLTKEGKFSFHNEEYQKFYIEGLEKF